MAEDAAEAVVKDAAEVVEEVEVAAEAAVEVAAEVAAEDEDVADIILRHRLFVNAISMNYHPDSKHPPLTNTKQSSVSLVPNPIYLGLTIALWR